MTVFLFIVDYCKIRFLPFEPQLNYYCDSHKTLTQKQKMQRCHSQPRHQWYITQNHQHHVELQSWSPSHMPYRNTPAITYQLWICRRHTRCQPVIIRWQRLWIHFLFRHFHPNKIILNHDHTHSRYKVISSVLSPTSRSSPSADDPTEVCRHRHSTPPHCACTLCMWLKSPL